MVIYVEVKPNEQLAKTCRKALKEAKLKKHIVEHKGRPLKTILTNSDPFRKLHTIEMFAWYAS